MKGKLPISDECLLESNEDQWKLLASGVINQLKTSMIVTLEGKRLRTNIVLTDVIPPSSIFEDFDSDLMCLGDSEKISDSLRRIHKVIISKYLFQKWIFIGYVDQETKLPLTIIYCLKLDKFVYSQQLATDKQVQSSIMMN